MAGRPKGHPKTGGRKKGSLNKIKSDVAILKERTAEQVRAMVAASITPLECMLAVMNDPSSYDERQFEAAKAAAPYVHARPTEKPPETPGGPSMIIIGEITDEQRIKALEALITRGKT